MILVKNKCYEFSVCEDKGKIKYRGKYVRTASVNPVSGDIEIGFLCYEVEGKKCLFDLTIQLSKMLDIKHRDCFCLGEVSLCD